MKNKLVYYQTILRLISMITDELFEFKCSKLPVFNICWVRVEIKYIFTFFKHENDLSAEQW